MSFTKGAIDVFTLLSLGLPGNKFTPSKYKGGLLRSRLKYIQIIFIRGILRQLLFDDLGKYNEATNELTETPTRINGINSETPSQNFGHCYNEEFEFIDLKI